MVARQNSLQRDQVLHLLEGGSIMRLSEFRERGITAATLSRLEREGAVTRLARGLYQLPSATLESHHTLAEAAKLVPRGVVCLVSALAFHELTDQIPAAVWLAIAQREWRPQVQYPPMHFARYPASQLSPGVEWHKIEGVRVPVFSVAKTIADLFRHRKAVGISVAVEGLKGALERRRASPAEIAQFAKDAGAWEAMEPYMNALVSTYG
jgi:predicted transcriptional regulator of viral defense system